MPTLEAISNSISALPIATSVGQSVSGRRAAGGFASTLAAAQDQSTPQLATGNPARSDMPTAGSAGVAGSLDVRTQVLGNPLPKKLPLNSPALAANIVALNTAVPEVMPVPGSQIVSVLPQNLLPLSLGLSGISSSVSEPQFPEITAGTVQTILQTTVQPTLAHGASVGNSVVSQAALASSSLISSETAGGKITQLSELTGVAPNANWKTTSQEIATANTASRLAAAAPAAITRGGALPNPSLDIQWSRTLNASGSVGPMAGNDIQPNAASTTVQPSAATPPAVIVENQQRNVIVTNGGVSSPTELTLVSIGTVNFAPLVSTIVAQANSNAGAVASPTSAAGSAIALASLSNPLPVQIDLLAQAATFSSTVGVPITVAPALNPSDKLGTKIAEPPVAAAQAAVAVNAPTIRGVEQHATAPTSTPAAASPAVPDLSPQSQPGSQTPFSIFFSGPGPGAESAAGTLPKMILPATSSVPAGKHNAGLDGNNASGQTNAPQNSNPHSVASQNLNEPAMRASSSSQEAVQPLRSGGDGNAASVVTAAIQIATAAAPATVVTVTPPAGAMTPTADPAGKTIAAPTPSGSATVAVLPETWPVAMTGPIQMAQLISRVQQAEMRIGMNTSAFGSVEVRAVVHANDVGLVVGSEKGDLRALLSNELPAIANTLQEQNLRLHSVNFMQGFAFSNNASGGGDSQPRPFIPLRAATDLAAREVRVEGSSEHMAPAEWSGEHNNLSILA
jgi:hypothetical protein